MDRSVACQRCHHLHPRLVLHKRLSGGFHCSVHLVATEARKPPLPLPLEAPGTPSALTPANSLPARLLMRCSTGRPGASRLLGLWLTGLPRPTTPSSQSAARTPADLAPLINSSSHGGGRRQRWGWEWFQDYKTKAIYQILRKLTSLKTLIKMHKYGTLP